MALRIVTAEEPMRVENLIVSIYGPPGVGKSSLAFTAKNPLSLDFDKGAYRSANRKAVVPVGSWADVDSITQDDLADYDTLIIDTAGRCLDTLAVDITSSNPKMGSGSHLSLQGFGVLKSRFTGWLNLMRSFRKDIVLISHMIEERKGEETVERIDAQGASKNEIYKVSDAMGRVMIGHKGQRILNLSPREGGFGKDPANMGEVQIKHPSQDPDALANLIQQMKDSINQRSEAQQQAVIEQQQWQEAFAETVDLDTWNAQIVPLMKEKGKLFISLAASVAKERGWVANKLSGKYEVPANA